MNTIDGPDSDTARDVTRTMVHAWLDEYICRPNDLIGRSGAVCPFVLPSLRADSLEVRVRPVGPTPSARLVTQIVRDGLHEFDQIEWRGSNQSLRSLLVAIPDLPTDQCHLLDEAHRVVKPAAVARGLMIGQFHPVCDEPAARNPEFRVSRSPVPLVAIRRMALHDILFLKDDPAWFAEYRARFGPRYRPGRTAVEQLFVALYNEACAEHRDAA